MTSIPVSAGIGLRHPHFRELAERRVPASWFEVHSENFMVDGGPSKRLLQSVRRDYPIGLHGVSLSLGSDEPPNPRHLTRLRELIQWVDPGLVSEHLSWSRIGEVYLNDLLPLPYTEEALSRMVQNVLRTQDFLGREILIENPSTYMKFAENSLTETEFLRELVARTGCKLLLDINNVLVSAHNCKFDPKAYVRQVPAGAVEEIHLAGHAVREIDGLTIRIDDHGSRVSQETWDLFEFAISQLDRRVPTLIEWDTDVPSLEVLMKEAAKADAVMASCMERDDDAVIA